ncbi:MAG: indolepyruvate ferredoxin oxidoreductase family protein [Phenylobacterium sp.]|uniref:indolepyruvate ferredoxin oxidoreductase family protein n=1 Tax=Phenylobacterium sp. TaxID=1871053 RepID=UPI0025E77DAE|nr:indolepyruvate ferredoxin oxidoreductase family protein [Phenylobacterium sp.]MCA3727516.1 indolepyruvate ferredoxin oxidoreductase family protein [Phenylobacterium sp.]
MTVASRMTLDHIYNSEGGRVFMTGIQALVRLPLVQRRRDRARGLNTAGLISGYRGSPLGAYDQQLWKAEPYLRDHQIRFQPGLNEDLAATALWGAQMHRAYGPSKVDGVFGVWYGKGPGVDRCGDVFRSANMLGTSPLGGVLAVAGDDHAAQSSVFPHQTDGIFQSTLIPILQPASVSEILSLGLAGFALSRHSGLWVAMKTIAEVVESAASFELPTAYPEYLIPDRPVPPHGLNWDPRLQWPSQRAELERRLIEERIPAAIRWAEANRLDYPVIGDHTASLCIVTVGKAHQDLMQALQNLGIGDREAGALGLSVYKVAMSWPLAIDPLIAFAGQAEEILVIEEKAPIVEDQIKAALFHHRGRPARVTGKTDDAGRPLLPAVMELSPLLVAQALAGRITKDPVGIPARLAALVDRASHGERLAFPGRKPYFCAGCPHNRSTRTPDGSISGGGIGCHALALSVPELKTSVFSHMGGEGAQWIGAEPFSETPHIFQNLGDGTYQHSGLLAIRAAVAAGANITFKILYNDAVAMTGGQPAEGAISPLGIYSQLLAEGVGDVRLVSDAPDRWPVLPDGKPAASRDDLEAIQRELRQVPGVTAILYEQTCAAEKRRRRKRGVLPDPGRRLFINPRVCEGCGDCSVQSGCIAIQPLETDDGVKRRIDQSACNIDFSCLEGFCPSFVEVEGAALRKPDPARTLALEATKFAGLPEPDLTELKAPVDIYVAGIGGLGVLTVGALLGSAAYHDGLTASVLDFTGLSQKNGSVTSQIRIAAPQQPIPAVRIGDGEADLLLGCDAVVAVSEEALRKFASGKGAAVLNTEETPTSDFVSDRDSSLPFQEMIDAVMARAGKRGFAFNATRISEALFGDNLAANTLMVGFAWQKGLLPMSAAAIDAAIEANGTAVDLNRRAFRWGRLAAIDLHHVQALAGLIGPGSTGSHDRGASSVERYAAELERYQDSAYSARFRSLVETAGAATAPYGEKGAELLSAIAANAFKVMAYKDEYEVARLYSEPPFRTALDGQFSGYRRLSVYLAPPVFSRRDKVTGRPRKRKFGPWMFRAMALLAKGKRLRGTWLDPFGYTAERKAERALRDAYLADIAFGLSRLSPETLDDMLVLARLPQDVRGFGPVKEAAMDRFAAARADLRARLM